MALAFNRSSQEGSLARSSSVDDLFIHKDQLGLPYCVPLVVVVVVVPLLLISRRRLPIFSLLSAFLKKKTLHVLLSKAIIPFFVRLSLEFYKIH